MSDSKSVPHQSDVPFYAGTTLRDTIQPLLERFGSDWSDVRGMSVTIHDRSTAEWVDPRTGNVDPSRLTHLLDMQPDEVVNPSRGWGFDADSDSKCINFSATIWLDDYTIRFSPRHLSGPYVGCDVVPTSPPAEFRLNLAANADPKP